MNAKKLILATAIFAAGSALADVPEQVVDFSNFVGTKTRAEVRAEVNNAAPAETLARNSQVVDQTKVAGTRTRAEVRAELADANRDSRYASAAPQQVVDFSNVASVRSRDEVRKEAVQSARAKEHVIGG